MDDLENILRELGFPQYVEAFKQNDIDMTLIEDLTLDELKEIGVVSLGHRKKILAGLKAAADGTSPNHTAQRATTSHVSLPL